MLSREVFRPANTLILAAWVGRVSDAVEIRAIEKDLTVRVARLPGLRYLARLHRVASGPCKAWIVTVQKAREFAPSEADSIADLFRGETLPEGWKVKTAAGRAARVNPPPLRIVHVRLSKKHAPDAVAWARGHKGIGDPWRVQDSGDWWDIYLTDPFETETAGWRTLSRSKGVFAEFGRVIPESVNPCHKIAPIVNPTGDDFDRREKEIKAALKEADRLGELACPDNGKGPFNSEAWEAFVKQNEKVQKLFREQSAYLVKAFKNARERLNPGPDPAKFADGVDRFVAMHWGRSPNEVRNVPRADVAATGPLVGLGELVEVVYRTRKGKDRVLHDWRHAFGVDESTGRDVGDRPVLAVDGRGRLYVVGGTYSVESRGIVG